MLKKNIILPAIIGNALEWYDFSLYGYFAVVISHLFFPTNNQTLSLVKTFGIFAAGFLMRPIGAILFGYFGDKMGRKKNLAASIILMALATTLMGLLPTYEQIGWWASILLMVCRLAQGLAVGGEFSGSLIYIAEHTPIDKRGLYSSIGMFGCFLGLLLGSLVGAVTTCLITDIHFAWRIPFVIGSLLGAIGLYIRLRMPETPEFLKLEKNSALAFNPLLTLIREYKLDLCKTTLLGFLPAMGFYLCFVYWISYLTLYLKLSTNTALTINSISMLIILLCIPFAGYLSDKLGRKSVLVYCAILLIIFSYPLFLLLQTNKLILILLAQIGFAILLSPCYAAIPAILLDMYPTKIRYTATAITYNLANTIFGGTAPLIVTFLINAAGVMAPSFYLIFASMTLLVVIGVLRLKLPKKINLIFKTH